MNKEILVAEIIGKHSKKILKNCRNFEKTRMWTWVNFGALGFGERISRLQKKFRGCQYAMP
jgi:hypothetical protein